MAFSETQRLTNIVGQLRQLYRPQVLQTMQPHDLSKIIEEVHTLLIPHLNNALVEWRMISSAEQCLVNCVKDQIIEVLLNISLNAVEAMQSSPVRKLSINMVHSIDRAQVGVILSDTGPGIKPELLPHLFEPFITTKDYGLGLGLSICYSIIQKHGGQITVESQPGQGTNFTIWLPLMAE
jgi:C4-dicarboxylate-specific signal transduction histidine kinase